VTSFKQFERLSQAKQLSVTYFRQGQILEAEITTQELSGKDVERVLFWAGLSLHAPHRAAQMQRSIGSDGIYIASYNYGSPATRYNIYAMRRIVEVDGVTTLSLDDFVEQVKNKQHRQSVLLKTLDFNNKEEVISLKLDTHYWPFFEVRLEDGQWHKVMH
jgi:PDZ domain-containing secreted protein